MAVQEVPREPGATLDDHEHCPCVERLRAALEKIAEGAHGVYLTAGIGTRVSHKTIESIAREALAKPKE